MSEGEGAPSRSQWRDAVEVLAIMIAIFSVLGLLGWAAFRSLSGVNCEGKNKFDVLNSWSSSPDGRFRIENRSFGDDCDAFSEWEICESTGSKPDSITLDPEDIDSITWESARTLKVHLRQGSKRSRNMPDAWHGIRFVYVDTS